MLLSSLGVSIANIALPTLVEAFAASFQQVQWVIIAYLLSITVMIVSVGRLGDTLGRRPVLLAGISLFIIASLICSLAPTLWVLITARAMQGLAAAILMTLTIALVRDTVPEQKTGRAMGLLGTMSAIGTALGPSLGGLLIDGSGWRAIFLIMVPIGALNLFLAYRYLPKKTTITKTEEQSFDWLGTIILGITLAAYALAVTTGKDPVQPINIALLLLSLIGGSLFIIVQTRVTSPLIELTILRNVVLTNNLIMNALVSTVMMATLVVGPFYLSQALELNALSVGVIMSIGPIISSLTGFPAGRLVDRTGALLMVITGLLAMTAGSFALSMLPAIFGITGYIVAIAILTPGYQLFQAANNTAVMMHVASDQRGVISGLLSLSRNIGLITGASVMGAVFAYASKNSVIANSSPKAVEAGMQATFLVATILIIIALGLSVRNRSLQATHLNQ